MKEFLDKVYALVEEFGRTACDTDCDFCELNEAVKIYTQAESSQAAFKVDICQILQDIEEHKKEIDKNGQKRVG